LGDLQCPAYVVLAAPGEDVSAIVAGHAVAGEFAVTGAGAELRARVDELSDLYRGETIVVVAPPEVIRETVGVSGPVTVAVDSSGWTVVR
jgi:hypothetical protein